jgi:peptidoglycan/xylan/chitin deacetylase (PgdA/CDA1 family)
VVKRHWRPRPIIRLSFVVHAAALVLVLAMPQAWGWALGAVLANHAALTLASLFPRCQLLGRSMRRLPPGEDAGRVALTFDDGPDPELTPRILALLKQHGAHATFFCIGQRAAQHPQLMREIRAHGHSVGNHTMRHRGWFALMGVTGQRNELTSAHAVLAATGPVSDLVRAPLGLRSPLSDLAFHQLGVRHVSWSRRGFDTRRRDADLVLARITKGLREGDIVLLHDGNAARDAAGRSVSLVVLEQLLPWLAARGLRSVSLGTET